MEEKLWNRNYVKVFSSNFLLNAAFMLLTPLLPIHLNETYGADKQTIGMVLSGYAVAALVVRPFSGFFVDSFPRKKVLLLLYATTALFYCGYLLAGCLMAFAIVRTLHGAPFGATGVSMNTVAIDVLPSSRRAEGIGYFGLSHNVATAISPAIGMFLYTQFASFELLFAVSLILSLIGVVVDSTLDLKPREMSSKQILSLDRFLMLKGWAPFIPVLTLGIAYSIVMTYVAIYGKEELGMTTGTGLFFTLFAVGLIVSRLTGGRSLRQGRIVRNATWGIVVSIAGFILFAAVPNLVGYYMAPFIIGLGNGHLWPAMQNMFINLAPNSQRGTANSTLLIGWDLGMGLGMLIGGIVSEHIGYHAAFWTAIAIYAVGILFYFIYVREYYERNKLR